jgi:TonB family protein
VATKEPPHASPRPTSTGVFGSAEAQRGGATPVSRVASAGFGEVRRTVAPRKEIKQEDTRFGGATPSIALPETRAVVQPGRFGTVAVQASLAKRQMLQVRPKDVEILFKPRPTYTEEARKLKIEGDVLVEVIFASSGEVKVIRVAQGLGYGLDEAVVQAAAGMRFNLAERDGVAVDSTATARITFRLAY